MQLDPAKANTIKFEPTTARFVRLTLSHSASDNEPCLDEIEVFAKDNTANLALASAGGKATASSSLAGYDIHKIEHLNDGRYGNDFSWVAAGKDAWVQIELAAAATMDRVVISRDRTGKLLDRMPLNVKVELSADGAAWTKVAEIKSAKPSPPPQANRIPPPSEPAANLTEAVKWLEGEAERVIRACVVRMKDGTTAFPPQIGSHYNAFWLRDYVYAVEGSIASFSDQELTDAAQVFVKAVSPEGAGVDCVGFGGNPIYKPGYGSMGDQPVLDGSPFTVTAVWLAHQRTKDKELLSATLDTLVKAMNYMPRNPTNGLARIKYPGERCAYGFTDSIRKSGDELFCSLLAVQASRQLGDLLEAGNHKDEAAQWRQEAARITQSVRAVFWDEAFGLFRATTGACNAPDIWGSAFAVWLDVATKEQAQKIAAYFKQHYDEIVQEGQVRHIPGFMDWNGDKTRHNGGHYQSGAFWATPVGWFVYTLDLADPALADKTVMDLVNHFKIHGACEWINGQQRVLPGYTASASLPLAGIRAMIERRAKSSPQ